jgi:hypothetical protein
MRALRSTRRALAVMSPALVAAGCVTNPATEGLLRVRLEAPSSATIEDATTACLKRTDWVVRSVSSEPGGVRLVSARALVGSVGVGVAVNSKGQSGPSYSMKLATLDANFRIYPQEAAPRMVADQYGPPMDDFWTCLTSQLEPPRASLSR